MDVPTYPRPLFITDAAINIAPDLDAKVDICQNAIDLAHVLGIASPRWRSSAAVETVNPKMASTLRRGRAVQDGRPRPDHGRHPRRPAGLRQRHLAEAARTKGIVSPVAGQADILLVPDLESGNMLAKQLTISPAPTAPASCSARGCRSC